MFSRGFQNYCGVVMAIAIDTQPNWWSETRNPCPKFKGSVKIVPALSLLFAAACSFYLSGFSRTNRLIQDMDAALLHVVRDSRFVYSLCLSFKHASIHDCSSVRMASSSNLFPPLQILYFVSMHLTHSVQYWNQNHPCLFRDTDSEFGIALKFWI